jgi:adenosylcobinamide-GDP ribazoletransferase
MLLLEWRAFWAISAVLFMTLLSGIYFKKRIGGITGDALGAANQLSELCVYVAIYLCL